MRLLIISGPWVSPSSSTTALLQNTSLYFVKYSVRSIFSFHLPRYHLKMVEMGLSIGLRKKTAEDPVTNRGRGR
jgi:hypothetical protein